MSYKILSLKNVEYKELNIILKSIENLGYIDTIDFYISISSKVLVIYDGSKVLEDCQIRELLLEYLI